MHAVFELMFFKLKYHACTCMQHLYLNFIFKSCMCAASFACMQHPLHACSTLCMRAAFPACVQHPLHACSILCMRAASSACMQTYLIMRADAIPARTKKFARMNARLKWHCALNMRAACSCMHAARSCTLPHAYFGAYIFIRVGLLFGAKDKVVDANT